jgi:hypothetical protein
MHSMIIFFQIWKNLQKSFESENIAHDSCGDFTMKSEFFDLDE